MTLLYLDVDGEIPPGFLFRLLHCIRLWGWPLEAVRYDRTARGWHVVVGVRRRLSPAIVVAAQAILGSDPKREAFNLMRVQQLRHLPAFWRSRFNVLYSRHSRGVKVSEIGA